MDWKRDPPVLVGEKVLWSGSSSNKSITGIVKWIGNIPEISSDWCVGIELDIALPNLGCNGFWKNRRLFQCSLGHGLLVPMEEIYKTYSKAQFRPISTENYSDFVLNDTQINDFTCSDFRHKKHKKTELRKNRYSYSESKQIEESFNNQTRGLSAKKEARSSTSKVLSNANIGGKAFRLENTNVKNVQREKSSRTNLEERAKASLKVNETLRNSQSADSRPYVNELIKSMNEVAGYFKEIKEEDERFEKQQTENFQFYDSNMAGHSKPKKLFSFLKWFNKKNKNEPSIKTFKESSAASSPMFPRKETSSCESLDTLFSTQTVRSFAYIPPTQYMPSAPPLDYEKSSYENIFEDFISHKNISEDTESIYDRRKKRKAPEPPRLSRENSLPTTLESKKNDENFDEIKTYHRRTVSESFKDKKAGAYCHVQGKKKAPQPPVAPLYPNIQKMTNQYSSLYKKKKLAPPPPELDSENQNPNIFHQLRKDIHNEEETKLSEEPKKDLTDSKKKDKEVKINQTSKNRLTKDVSLSPLPSRPWYKRSHRDSTGSNIIRKDVLKGIDKRKNKETDDWMPEVGFPRRRLSTESSHSKFNIFSKLEKTEDKKKEEKRKSQISILTNISELDREAAEIVRKEQAEEKKLIAANDAKYYLLKENNDKVHKFLISAKNVTENLKSNSKVLTDMNKLELDKTESELNENEFSDGQSVLESVSSDKSIGSKGQMSKDEALKTDEKNLKDTENNLNPNCQSNVNAKQKSFSSNVLADSKNSSNLSPIEKISKPNQSLSPARLNYFNVQNKQLNYLNEPWVCDKCTLENPGWRIFCEICSSVKSKFAFNSKSQITEIQEEKETIKSKPLSIEVELKKPSNAVSKESNQHTIQVFQTVENKKDKSVKSTETLDELRKKQTNFFILKSEGLGESNVNELKSRQNDSEKKNMKKFLKEMKDSISKNNPNEENSGKIIRKPEEVDSKEHVKKELDDSLKENNAVSKENTTINTVAVEQKKDKIENLEQAENSNILEETPQSNICNISKWETAQNSQTQTKNHSEVIEAYVVTKTIVLEDIVVKKPERGQKVSTSAQTNSTHSTSPGAIRPPPRTKKISFENTNETNKKTQIQSHSENGFQNRGKNFRQENLEELSNRLTQAEGLADFRANIESMPLNTELNTVAVNRLLRKLEMAINCGDHCEAAGLAKELALLKINCSVTRQSTSSPSTSKITIDLYIEDKISHQGPIPLKVSPTMSFLQLKKKIQQEFGIPLEVQRWILNKKLANDDNKTLEAEGIRSDKCPLFLYLVVPDNRKTHNEILEKSEKNSKSKKYQDLKLIKESSSNPKTEGWYYNYEEDHHSYCEDSEDKSNSADSKSKTKEEILVNNLKKTETDQKGKITEKPLVLDLKSRDAENNIEKELKFISVNSVKQKVKELNKTFAENARPIQPPLRPSRSLETWKCNFCNIVNLPGRLNCLSCSAKKSFIGPNSKKTDHENRLFQAKSLQKDHAEPAEKPDDNIHYKELMELQDADLVPNSEPFYCSICMTDFAREEGVTLKDCLHTFCRTCLLSTVQYSEDAEVKCPYFDKTYSCPSVLQEREIKALVPQKIYELHLAKSVKEAENKIENAFHCKTPDCKGWCIYEDNVNEFRCPVCRSINCLTCQAIHIGINCREYQERMKDASETDVDAKKTRDMLNEMVEKGEAMACPKCQVVLMKKWGCDWLKCSVCKTEICWVTRGFRWGPEGKGDTSGGCKCGVNGIKCHPKCNYCH